MNMIFIDQYYFIMIYMRKIYKENSLNNMFFYEVSHSVYDNDEMIKQFCLFHNFLYLM